MKPVCIVGGGYYGCHLAVCCLKWGIPFHLFEMQADLFTKSSRWNQNRLHLGFHYARSHKTRVLCRDGFDKFMSQYSKLTNSISNNYYLVSNNSLLDAKTYDCIMDAMDLSYTQVDLPHIKNVQSVIRTDERFINPAKAHDHFYKLLAPYTTFNVQVTPEFLTSGAFSHVFDCTNNHLFPSKEYVYEQTVSFVYKGPASHDGYTFVDGPCGGSLYPYDIQNNLYTLTHVKWTPVGQSSSHLFSPIPKVELQKRQKNMEAFMTAHMPHFLDKFEYRSYFTSLKCKPIQSGCDARTCFIRDFNLNKTPVTSVLCGKITGIFQFEDHAHRILKATC